MDVEIISDIFRSKAEANMQDVTFDFHLSGSDRLHIQCPVGIFFMLNAQWFWIIFK